MFPGVVQDITAEDVDALFRFIASGIPATDLLRQAPAAINPVCSTVMRVFP
jgi:hypothetical protein